MSQWPLQSECDAFYGNPRGKGDQPNKAWMAANLVTISPLFKLTYAGKPIRGISIHRKCADSLERVLDDIWMAARQDQATIDGWGISIFAGSFNYRLMRGLNRLSMHSYGCAVDFDPARNGLHDATPHFANCPEILAAFKRENWVWGGDWQGRKDGMHFQAARVG